MVHDYSQMPVTGVRGSFVKRYWRGEYSLAVSLLIFGLGISVARLAIEFAIMMGLYVVFHARGAGLIACLLVMLAVDVVLVLWQVVGAFRSSRRSVAKGMGRALAVLAALVVLAIVLFSGALVIGNIWNAVMTLSHRL